MSYNYNNGPETQFQFYLRIWRIFWRDFKVELKQNRDYLLTVKVLKFIWETLYLREILKFSAYYLYVGFLICIALSVYTVWISLKLTWRFVTCRPFMFFYRKLWKRIRLLLKILKLVIVFIFDIISLYGQLNLKISKKIDDWFEPYLNILRKYRTALYRAIYYEAQRYYMIRDYLFELFEQTLVYEILNTSFILISKIIRLLLKIVWFFLKILLENVRDTLIILFNILSKIFNILVLFKHYFSDIMKYCASTYKTCKRILKRILAFYNKKLYYYLNYYVDNYPYVAGYYRQNYPKRWLVFEYVFLKFLCLKFLFFSVKLKKFLFLKFLFFFVKLKKITGQIKNHYKKNYKYYKYYKNRKSNYWKIRHKISSLWYRHRRKIYIILIFVIPHYLSKLEDNNVWYCLFLNGFLIFFVYYYILPTEDFRYLFAPLREASIKWSLNRFFWKDHSYWQTLVSTRLNLRLNLKIFVKFHKSFKHDLVKYELNLFPEIEENWEIWCTWGGFAHIYRNLIQLPLILRELELRRINLHYIILRHLRYAKYRKYLYKKVRNTCNVERYGDNKYLIPYYVDRPNNCYGGYINIKEYKWARENTKTEYMGKSRDDCLWTGL